MSKGSYTWRDRSREVSSFELAFIDIASGGGNFDTVAAAIAAVGADLQAMSLCTDATEKLVQETQSPDPTIPTDVHAQREFGLRIFYSDDVTGKVYNFTVPGPDFDNIVILPQSDNADMTDAPLSDLITTMEGSVLSPVGNAITVERAVVVGRNN